METRMVFVISKDGKPRSYRTYEEWKLTIKCVAGEEIIEGSYRTYEEWKPFNRQTNNIQIEFLPYL